MSIKNSLLIILLFLSFHAAGNVYIGVSYDTPHSRQYRHGKDGQQEIAAIIRQTGGVVIPLFSTETPAEIQKKMRILDGLILAGGDVADLNPAYYGQAKHPATSASDPAYDRLEFSLLRHAQKRQIPVFGICRGFQVINVFYGGTLVQDTSLVPAVKKAHRSNKAGGRAGITSHPIDIEPGSLLFRLAGKKQITVNSWHHQVLGKIGTGLRVTARGRDGVAEAIERTGPVPVMGVQFHPEKMLHIASGYVAKNIFSHFIQNVRDVKTKKILIRQLRTCRD